MSSIFYIYHLPGRKVGCTSNPIQRFLTYRSEGYQGEIIILEKLRCTAHQAGDREWAWANHFGYKRGWHYSTSFGGRAFKAKMVSKTYKANPNKVKFTTRKRKK
jgi:hypothetical protein